MKKIIIFILICINSFSQEHKSLFYTDIAGINNPGFIGLNEINHLTLEQYNLLIKIRRHLIVLYCMDQHILMIIIFF